MKNFWFKNLLKKKQDDLIDEQDESIEEAEETLASSQRSLKLAASSTQTAAFDLISDLKSAVESREKKYQILVENIQDGMYILHNKKFAFANKALCKMIGLERDEIIGKELKDVVNITKNYADIISSSNNHREYNIKYITKTSSTNKIVTVWETLSYDENFADDMDCDYKDSEDRNIIAIGTVKDITTDVEKESMLKAFSLAINDSSDTIMVVSNSGSIMFVNDSFENTYGFSLKEVAGENPRMLKSGIHDVAFYERMWTTLQSGQEWRGVVFNKAKDGRIIEDDTKIIPFMNGADIPMFYMAIKKIRRVYSSVESVDILRWNSGKPNRM